MRLGSLSSAPLKKEKAQDSFRGMMIAMFFFKNVKQGLPHLSSSVRSQPIAILRSLSVSFCHFVAYGTFMAEVTPNSNHDKHASIPLGRFTVLVTNPVV